MAYSDFRLEEVITQFQLTEQSIPIFESITPIPLSDWLQETLAVSQQLALLGATDKARSEFIVAPVLLELQRHNPDKIAIYSGKRLDVDSDRGLNGECDFILGKGAMSHVINAPIIAVVEAKKQDLEIGLGQCAAQMVGGYLFNQKKGQLIPTIYGCVTTAENWQFLKLADHSLLIEPRTYYLNELELILGIFEAIIEAELVNQPSRSSSSADAENSGFSDT